MNNDLNLIGYTERWKVRFRHKSVVVYLLFVPHRNRFSIIYVYIYIYIDKIENMSMEYKHINIIICSILIKLIHMKINDVYKYKKPGIRIITSSFIGNLFPFIEKFNLSFYFII